MKLYLKRVFRLNYIFYFFISSLVFLFYPYRYEKRVLDAYVKYVNNENVDAKKNPEKFVLYAMQRLHNNMTECGQESIDLNATWIENLLTSPTMQYALSKDGACGGFTLALAQILQQYGFKIRPVQMKVSGKYGGHIVLETKLNGKWIVLDPLYNQSYRNEKGQLATFEEIGQNWDFYKKQTPAYYDTTYKFEGKRHTNWDRLPLLGNFAKKTISVIAGKEETENFSLRSYILNPRRIIFVWARNITILLFALILYRKFGKSVIQKWRNKSSS